MKNTLALAATAGIAAVLAAASGAGAQTAEERLGRGQTVLERARPELEPLGLRAGSFFIFPQVEAGVDYTDNVFAEETDEQDDFIYILNPSIAVRSDFGRHFLGLRAEAEIGRYSDFDQEDYEDYEIFADGRLDVGTSAALIAQARYQELHEERGDPEAEVVGNRAEVTEYSVAGGSLGAENRFNRVRVGVTGQALSVDYDDVPLVGGGVADQDDRDRWEYDLTARVSYEIQPDYEAFVQGTYTVIEYDQEEINHDSDGYEVVVGTALDLTGLITGEVFAGYQTRDYDDEAREDFEGLTFGGRVIWLPTQLTTVTFEAKRGVRETTIGGADSFTETLLAVGVDHELLRSLILSARLEYETDVYEGIDRDDDYLAFTAGANYYLNRNLFVRAFYTREQRDSTVAGEDYEANIFALRLGAQL